MIRRVKLSLAGAVLSVACCACGQRDISSKEAHDIIAASPLLRKGVDGVEVEAISQESSGREAIVRASIAGVSATLKFRRYDKGWSWDFFETSNGEWVSPADGVGQIRETNRVPRVLAWVTANTGALPSVG